MSEILLKRASEIYQGQVGWSPEEPGLVEGFPVHGKEWNSMTMNVLSNPKPLMIL